MWEKALNCTSVAQHSLEHRIKLCLKVLSRHRFIQSCIQSTLNSRRVFPLEKLFGVFRLSP